MKCQHEGQKAFRCPHCNKSFSQNGNLQEHIRIHTGHKPFTCEICGRKFTTSSQHRLHVKRHKGEKPWACQFCPKAFLHKESWTAHMRRHRGDRPFVCEFDFCKKGFAELWALKKHMRLHTGEKPYTCKLCPKSFSDCSNLTKHTKTHLKDANSSLYAVTPSVLPTKSLEATQLESNKSVNIIGTNPENAPDATSDLSLNQPSGKAQVWNILNEAANQATSGTSGLHSSYTTQTGEQPQDEDVQQIIYITYDAEDKEMQVINEKTNVSHVQPVEGTTLQPGTEDVLSQLSAVASNLQPQSIVIPSPQTTDVAAERKAIGPQPSSSSVAENMTNWTINNENATKESPGNVIVDNNSQSIIHPTPSVMTNQETQQIGENGEANDEGGNVYVDIRLTDNELEQPIRLRVPPNFDPIAYATEYIQLHTAQSESEGIMQNQNLEQLEMQNVERQNASESVSRSDEQITPTTPSS